MRQAYATIPTMTIRKRPDTAAATATAPAGAQMLNWYMARVVMTKNAIKSVRKTAPKESNTSNEI